MCIAIFPPGSQAAAIFEPRDTALRKSQCFFQGFISSALPTCHCTAKERLLVLYGRLPKQAFYSQTDPRDAAFVQVPIKDQLHCQGILDTRQS